jgi:Ca2+-binding RTX toxin-like protein
MGMVAYTRVGSELTVNSTYARSQTQADVAQLANGRFIVTWLDAQPGTTADRYVRAQIFESDGTPAGGELTLAGPLNGAIQPTITGLAGGGFVVAWDGFSDLVQVFDASGTPVAPAFTLPTGSSAKNIDIAALPDGGFAVTWQDDRTSGGDVSDSGIHLRTYDAAGVAVSGDVLVNTATAGEQEFPSIAVLAGGGFVVTWIDTGGPGTLDNRWKAQIFDATGAAVGGEVIVNPGGGAFSDFARVTALPNGNFAVAYTMSDPDLGPAHRIQIFSPSGEPIGELITMAANHYGGQLTPMLAGLADGSLAIAWVGNFGPASDGSGTGIFVQVYGPNGQPRGGAMQVNTQGNGEQTDPAIVALDNGGFVITWTDLNGTGADDDEVKAQVFGPDGVSDPVAISSYGGGDTATVAIAENDFEAGQVTAHGGSGAISYAITGGADAALFYVDPTTGTLNFVSMPDFETPADADGDNVYEVIVSASDGTSSDAQAVSVTVSNVNERPTIVSGGGGTSAIYDVVEGDTAVTTVLAEDVDGPGALTYAIGGGADAALFTIDAATGALSFLTAPDFEAPADEGADNFYNVTVTVSDGELSTFQALSIIVNERVESAPLTFLTTDYSSYENTNTILMFDVTGGNGSISYSIVGGADAALFGIDHSSASLFLGMQDFEAPADADGDGLYEVEIAAVSGAETVTATITVNVGNANDGEGPFFLTAPEWAVAEGEDVVGLVQAPSTYEGSVTYSIIGGFDQGSLVIDANTGELRFAATPDFETPADFDGDNVYEVLIGAESNDYAYNGMIATQWVTITVTDVAPEPTPVGFAQTAFEVPEVVSRTVALEITGAQAYGYSIVGGADGWLFDIDWSSGELSMIFGAFDFESPYDSDGDNVYEVAVEAWTDAGQVTSTITVAVRDAVNEELFFVTGSSWTAYEGETVVGTVEVYDAQYDALTFAIAGGADAALFKIDPDTGRLSFLTAPDLAAPGDADGDNVYKVELEVSDGQTTEYQAVTVTVEAALPSPFVQSDFAVDEHQGLLVPIELVDPNLEYNEFWISGGADRDYFLIDSSTGELTFSGEDFEWWADADGDNVYEVEVSAVGGSGNVTDTVRVTVRDVNEAPIIYGYSTFAIDENSLNVGGVPAWDPEGAVVAYSISGTDSALFTIDPYTSALRFLGAPDFEAPADADGDNTYDLIVEVSDGSLTASQAITVTVRNVNEAPVVVSNGAGASAALTVSENTIAVTTVAATDPEGAVTYSLAGGQDASLFSIDAATGELRFIGAPDFEAPADADGDNVYEVIVRASDGSLADSQALSITVGDVAEAPVITSNGGGASATVVMNENSTSVTNVAATASGNALSYAIFGGADAALFAIDAASGELRFLAAPDAEAPGDADGNNVYDVVVGASDGTLEDTQALAVTVANLVDGVTITGTSKNDQRSGTYEEDTIWGLGGNDTLYGLGGADILDGGDGTDKLYGGAGADLLTGGLRADTFYFTALSDSIVEQSDRITDFNRAQGDRIDLAGIDANIFVDSNQAFSFIGNGAFSNIAGQLRYFQQDGDTFIQGDVNGDSIADFQVILDPLVNIVANDFVL